MKKSKVIILLTILLTLVIAVITTSIILGIKKHQLQNVEYSYTEAEIVNSGAFQDALNTQENHFGTNEETLYK